MRSAGVGAQCPNPRATPWNHTCCAPSQVVCVCTLREVQPLPGPPHQWRTFAAARQMVSTATHRVLQPRCWTSCKPIGHDQRPTPRVNCFCHPARARTSNLLRWCWFMAPAEFTRNKSLFGQNSSISRVLLRLSSTFLAPGVSNQRERTRVKCRLPPTRRMPLLRWGCWQVIRRLTRNALPSWDFLAVASRQFAVVWYRSSRARRQQVCALLRISPFTAAVAPACFQ
jgi:hypothetical protein